MIIKRIKLENIRSYEEAEIEFPKGSILLSGDIGSGKSTILLALEFALFGLQPGFIRGSSLLRYNADSGSVELEFEIDGKNVVIKRTLERKKDNVAQGKRSSISINNKTEQLGPEELKARVLELMNYPPSMLKARTNLLFRFTLYTPQEEMKQILLEKADERINTLRKIFGIDKYKNIIFCSEIIISKLKEKIKILEAQILDIEQKKQEKNLHESKIAEEDEKINEITPHIKEIVSSVESCRKQLEQLNQKIKKLNDIKSELSSLKVLLKTTSEQKQKSSNDIKNLNKSMEGQQKEKYIEFKDIDFKSSISSFNVELNKHDKDRKNIIINSADYNFRKKSSEEIKQKIVSLVKCPTCMQYVPETHKNAILTNCDEEIKKCDDNLNILRKKEREIEEKIAHIKNEIEKLHEQEKEARALKLGAKMIEEQKKLRDNILQSIGEFEEKEESIKAKIILLEQEFSHLEKTESEYKNINEKLEEFREKEKHFEIKKAQHEKQIEYYKSRLYELINEIRIKEKIYQTIINMKKLNEWLATNFVNMIYSIEKAVMVTINKEFNMLFGKWFLMFVDNLNARVDEDFSPLIEQEGYEIDYESLSGGERTAAALSYRLALNQIISSLMSKLSTKNILILDEPTDGFSSEQLDKMRDIFQEIKAEQLILVSHESKIESFVDSVIKFAKKGNISFITPNYSAKTI